MRTVFYAATLLALTITLPRILAAQYWGERVLEKGFEQTEFFFVPSNLTPYGIGSFKFTTPGLVDDPLLNLAVSPAHFRIDSLSDTYVYADFRSARTIHDQGYGYVPPWLTYARSDMAILPYPWVYLNSRRELEPVFSGAYLGRPLPQTLPNLLMGATYQLILQDDKYYSVPQDIYRSVIGMDYAGNRAAVQSIPIVDRYSGQDNMHQLGHFVSAFGRYEAPYLGSVGVKVGRAMFNRSGSIGSSNLWEYPSLSTGTSLWSNLESRSQGYGHWELTGGAELFVSEQTTVGATAGWLWGNATQALHRGDSSYYSYSSTYDRSFYVRSGNTQEEWRHNGRAFLFSADVTSHLTPKHTMHLLYQRQRTTVDLDLGSTIVDTSSSIYSYLGPDPPTMSTSYSMLRDQRGGSGRTTTATNRVLAALQWQLDERVSLALGAQLDWQMTETKTAEGILARMQSVYQSSGGDYYWNYGSDESKDLLWTFKAERTSFRIPVFLTMRASDAISVLLGLNRTMTHSKVDDVTLALFRYRQSNSSGTITREESFGERYTQPTEEVSDVRTTFLAGLIAAPSKYFRVQLLVVPNFHDTFEGSELEQLQWWIGFKIMP
jgi:hypothetical protein